MQSLAYACFATRTLPRYLHCNDNRTQCHQLLTTVDVYLLLMSHETSSFSLSLTVCTSYCVVVLQMEGRSTEPSGLPAAVCGVHSGSRRVTGLPAAPMSLIGVLGDRRRGWLVVRQLRPKNLASTDQR
ncbi:hypothetical protein VPH35_015097 [Triticum aestivum]